MIHIWSSLYTTMHHIWSALYTTLSTNIRISASAWKNWFQIVVGIKLTEINHMLEKVGEIFTYYQMEKVGESWTQSNVDLLVEVSLVEPSLHVVAVHQHPPLLRQEVGNHLDQRKSFLQTVFSWPQQPLWTWRQRPILYTSWRFWTKTMTKQKLWYQGNFALFRCFLFIFQDYQVRSTGQSLLRD